LNPCAWPERWRIEGALILAAAGGEPFRGAIEIAGGRIVALGPALPPAGEGVARFSRPGALVLPGFVQGHVHLCQTLLRGLAEDLPLERWLRERIWPLEAAHDPESLRASARLGLAEALLQGATTLLDMGTVRHTEVIAAEAVASGARVRIGKALMDAGDGVPAALLEEPGRALREALDLDRRWSGAAEGRIGVLLAPRFTLSVSAGLWREIAAAARERRLAVHTHASETTAENEACRRLHGGRPIEMLERWGVLAGPTILVHAVHLTAEEIELLARRPAAVVHCPGSNAKLGSGIADLAAMDRAGIPLALGSDGAACNDALSVPAEMRLAAQLQSLRQGPGLLGARRILAMATGGGARALGLEGEIGALAPGKRADLIVYDEVELAWEEEADIASRLVYASAGLRPREVYVDGRPLVLEGRLVRADLAAIRAAAARARARLLARAGWR